jgi:RNA recognition motif-containing protein
MWVGNVPDDTTHDELWKFLKRKASPGSEPSEPVGDGVSSIFLISRSNCAFVNYDTEESLQSAIARFNGSQLRPQEWRCPKLVCRVRRKEDDLRAGVGGQRGMGVHTRYIQEQRQKEKLQSATSEDELSSPVDRYSSLSSEAGHPPAAPSSDEEATRTGTSLRLGQCARVPSGSSYASTNSSFLSRHFPKRFFILKSLSQVRISRRC